MSISAFCANHLVEKYQPYPADLGFLISLAHSGRAKKIIGKWPAYRDTPLLSLDGLADQTGVKAVFYKDEASRFGLGSFKALGGAYAVFCLLVKHIEEVTGTTVSVEDILSGKYKDIAENFTVACATAGNHGRSVAWGAELFGCPCFIYLHGGVGRDRAEAIAGYGAEIIRVEGNYDDSVRVVAQDAVQAGWTIVSDTSYPGYMEIPKYVMEGYAVMLDEVIGQLGSEKPTHMFAQGGVGGLASAAVGCCWDHWGGQRPKTMVVEPEQAACLFESARKGKITSVRGKLDTYMLGLACGEPSLLAWEILSRGVDYFLTIPDEDIFNEMRTLAKGIYGGGEIVAGESAVAGLVGFKNVAADPDMRNLMGLTAESVVLLFGTEGDTDPALYRKIVNEGYNGKAV